MTKALLDGVDLKVMAGDRRFVLQKEHLERLGGLDAQGRIQPNQTWLNDEIVDGYGRLIAKRSSEDQSLPKVEVFTTHSLREIKATNYEKVRRMNRHKCVYGYQKILIPICEHNRWTLVVVDVASKEVWSPQ